MYLAMLIRPWSWPHDLETDLDIINMYLPAENEVVGQGIEKLEEKHDILFALWPSPDDLDIWTGPRHSNNVIMYLQAHSSSSSSSSSSSVEA